MSQATDRLQELRTLIVRSVRESTGMHEALAVPIAMAITHELQRRYGGRELYIHAPGAEQRDQAIRDAIALGLPIGDACQRYGVSRPTVYRALKRGAAA